MTKRKSLVAMLVASATAGLLIPCVAVAQSAQTAGVTTSDQADEEIIVTAQRRSEDLRSVPIAVTTLSGEEARERGVVDTAAIATVTPGLEYNHIANAATPYIRGVGAQLVAIGTEPSVATYLDDLYIPQGSAALFQLNSIDRISVLRGPQGTLFGRNATGGVVQVLTRNPDGHPALDIGAGYANYDAVSANVYLSGPLTNHLSANLALYSNDQRDGWGRDLITGEDAFTSRDYGGLAKLLWTLREGSSVLLTLADNYTASELGLGAKPVPGSPFHSILTDLAAAVPGSIPNGGFYDTYDAPLNDEAVTRWQAASLRYEQNLGWARFASITGWQQQRGHAFFNQDGSPLALVYARIGQADDNRSQEFQLISPDDARIRWIVGSFLYWDRSGYHPLLLTGAAFGFPDPLGPDMLVVRDAVTTKSYAVYGQASGEILPDTTLTLGLRYTDDDRTASGGMSSIVSGVSTPITSQLPARDASWSRLTYRVAIDHRFDRNTLLYASYNRGFKSGVFDMLGVAQPGFDPEFPDGRATTARPVDPEILDAYEIGARATLFDNRLRLSAAAFYNDFQNIQALEIITGGTRTFNAGAAQIKGLEIEFSAIPTSRLTISGGLSLMRGEYTDFPSGPLWQNNPAPFPATPVIATNSNLTGNDTVQTPHMTANLAFDYRVPMRAGDINFDLSFYHNDGFFWEPDNSVSQPAFTLINASIDWTSPNQAFEVRVWGRNLSNERYFSWATTTAVGSMYSPAPPMTFGVSLSYHFAGAPQH